MKYAARAWRFLWVLPIATAVIAARLMAYVASPSGGKEFVEGLASL